MRALLLLGLLAACGGERTRTVARPQAQPQPPASGAGDALAIDPKPSDAECDALIAHAVGLGAADRKATDDEQAHVRGELRGRYLASCRDMSRHVYSCALAASSLDALEACQPTRSSSTSNSSVEPGGITPGTPRAP